VFHYKVEYTQMKKILLFIFIPSSLFLIFVSFTIFSNLPSKILGIQKSNTIIRNLSTDDDTEKFVVLTFDDGPAPITLEFLKILQESDVKATFFVTGESIDTYPDILKQIHEGGHTIGNHTNTHPIPFFLSKQELAKEILITEEKIHQITGIRPKIVRAPYALYPNHLLEIVDLFDLTLISWDVDPEDWKKIDKDLIAKRVTDNVESGSIILLHDGPDNLDRNNTLEALKLIIIKLREENYQFKSISDLM
jgi:peptidoglycan/xylan/chitin deacetylase (PgdA/CDA1 family)